jgi:hypothetical protein
VVPRKGEDPYAIQAAANDLELSGYTDFVFKSDGEASIKALKRRAVEELRKKVGEVRVQYEEAGTGESQQNAHVERAIWEVEGLARTNVFAAEALHGVKTTLEHPLRIWAIEYAGQMINRAQVSSKD